MSEELKPCPFCGGEAECHQWWSATISGDYATFCTECGCGTDYYKTEAETIAAWNARAERTCECVAEYSNSPIDGKTIVLHRCSACHELVRPHMNYCPHCGAKLIEEKGKGNDGE